MAVQPFLVVPHEDHILSSLGLHILTKPVRGAGLTGVYPILIYTLFGSSQISLGAPDSTNLTSSQ